jgi:hypothetical protein
MLSIPEQRGRKGTLLRLCALLSLLTVLSLSVATCASSHETPPETVGTADASEDATQDSGGRLNDATTDSSSATGDANAGVDGDGGCVHQGPPVLDPASLPACSCSGAHCVPNSLVPSASTSLLANCDTSNKCVPDNFIVSGGNFIAATCVSVNGSEGRCLSKCLPAVQAKAAQLPQSTCTADELCSPCYDPVSGANTGACNLSCDPGPQKPPSTLGKCCGNNGTCVPSASVPDSQKSQLGVGDCAGGDAGTDAGGGYLCVPTELISAGGGTADGGASDGGASDGGASDGGGGFIAPTCRSLDNAEGRCLSTCLPSIGAQASSLPQSTCSADHLCAPCYDPITGADTGACHIGSDPGPQEPAVTFPKCCSNNGTCVPSSSVATSQQSQLGADTCPVDANKFLCAPNEFTTAGGFTPPTCRSLGNGEGRCLSTCLPSIAAQASTLPQSTCAAGHLCAPCYDPLTGADTNACHVSNDPGPQEPPFTFPKCCSSNGTCVPTSTVPASEQSQLGADSCPSDANKYLCAPTEFTAAGGFTPPTCRSLGNGEGRCLSSCLPSIAAQSSKLPASTCAANHLCAPCYDPLSGADTGACHVSNDPGPQEPAFTFPSCCTNRGVCVPMSAVPTNQQSLLGTDTCPSGQSYLCVAPRAFATNASYKPPSCTGALLGFINYTGVCLPDCLPSLSGLQGVLLPQGTCTSSTDKCAPCVNPLTQQNTGACN